MKMELLEVSGFCWQQASPHPCSEWLHDRIPARLDGICVLSVSDARSW